jgi:hypothetical protein
MSHRPFLTPACTIFHSRLHSPVPGTSLYVVKVTFSEDDAKVVRAAMRYFLQDAFGRVEGSRAPVPLYDLGDGRWVLDFVNDRLPTICDQSGAEYVAAKMPHGSLVRVLGYYEAKTMPGLIPVMTAIQLGKVAETGSSRLFDDFDMAA